MIWALFAIFHFFEICGKIAETTQQNWYPQKTSKTEAQGVPEFTQNGSKLIENSPEIEKVTKNY